MTGLTRSHDDFDQHLIAWLRDSAPPAVPDGLLDGVIATTASTARRPSWWAPGGLADVLISRRTAARGFALAATIAALTLGTVFIVAIGSRPRVPVPPGAPGLLLAARAGEALLIDPSDLSIRATRPAGTDLPMAAWSPDGGRIALWDGSDAASALVITDSGLVERFRIPIRANAGALLTWSPDGRRIALSIDDGDGVAVYVVDAAAGAVPARITDYALAAESPVWSPDGRLIAFRGGVGIADEALYVARPNGGDVTRLSRSATAVAAWCPPAWAPDGSSILFDSQENIWSVRPDGTDEHLVIGTGRQEYCPTWSPDGRRIAFAAWLDAGKYAVVADADGGNEVIPDGPLYDDAWPLVWSPDGKALAMNGRILTGGTNPTAILDPAGVLPARTAPVDAFVLGWQRLEP